MAPPPNLTELSAEQRRQLIDAQQAFSVWRPAAHELSNMGGLYWNTSHATRYLYSKREGARESLGRETPELARKKDKHDARSRQLRGFVRPLRTRLDRMAPVNRALRIGRLPKLAAMILRELDRHDLLGQHIIVAGTNALYAYETAAGVLVGGEYVATGDADLLWDSRRSLELAGSRIEKVGLMGMLRGIDPSFRAHYGYNATNQDGYIVDLICPEQDGLPTQFRKGADLEATPMTGAQWLLDSPRFEQIIIAEDGMPLWVAAPEPRTYALHKLWLSRRQDRQPVKRPRDLLQAQLVAGLARTYLGLSFKPSEMPWLPSDLKSLAKEL